MKKRLSLLLAFLLVISLIAVNVIAEGTDYASNVEGTAVFNPALNAVDADGVTTYGVAYITDMPSAGLNMSMEYTISLEGLMEQTFYIADVYVDDTGYWYLLEALEGESLPGNLATKSWVYQNDIPSGTYLDTLLVTPPAPKPTEPTDPSDSSESCGCCENCTNAAGCECGCESCVFCQQEETEAPSITDPETDVVVWSESFPQGVTQEVSQADVSSQLNKFHVPASKQVFGLDISLVNADNTEYQPGAALVKVPVTAAPGSKIGILHNDSFMGVTEVLSDGTVEFYTDSFSEFAGFTVDFHYSGVDFSIDGKTSILLSELFAEMGIQEDAYAAESVVFSNDSLVTTERLVDGDWLLTSLEAFQTEETLVITFSDDRTIVIDVTDDYSSTVDFGISGIKSHFSSAIIGTYNPYVSLYESDGKTQVARVRASNVISTAWLSIESADYFFEVMSYENMSNGDDYTPASGLVSGIDKHTIATGGFNLVYWGDAKPEIKIKRHSTVITDSSNSYCAIKQVSEFVKNGDTIKRTVKIYLDGELKQTIPNILFPHRGENTDTPDDIMASDIASVTPKSGYYKRGSVGGSATITASGDTYNIYLVTRGTIAYDPNGGTGAPASQYKYHGVNLTLQSSTPTKTYSNFKGWATSKARADAGTVDYAAGGTYTGNLTPNSTTTLYAVWEYANVNYTVKHYKQNLAGTGYDEVTADRQTITAKAYDKVTPNVKSYEGFTAPATQTVTVSGDGTTVVEYKYSRNSYNVTVNANTTNNGIGSVTGGGSYKYGASVTINATVNSEYQWVNWTGTATVVSQSYTFTMPASNVDYTANAKPIDYTITYKYEDGVTADKIVHYDIEEDLTLEGEPQREGYNFLGWELENVTGTNWTADTYNAGQKIGTGKYGNVVLVAQWEGKYSYKLNFDANGGTGAPDTMTADWNEHAQYTFRWTQVPTRDGYNFMGWARTADSTENVAGETKNSYTMTGEKNTVVKETLHAIWERQTGDLALDHVGSKPAIVTVEGEGLNITLVLSSDMTIGDLPTGTYTVSAEGAVAKTTVTVSDAAPVVATNQTTTVEVSVSGVTTNWFTGFSRKINIFKKEGEG